MCLKADNSTQCSYMLRLSLACQVQTSPKVLVNHDTSPARSHLAMSLIRFDYQHKYAVGYIQY